MQFDEDDTLITQLIDTEQAVTATVALRELTVSHQNGDATVSNLVNHIASDNETDDESRHIPAIRS